MIFEPSTIPDLICFQVKHFIGGFDICDKGQVKDTRGECQTAYKLEEDVKPREIKKPFRTRNLRKYLQSKYKF